MASCGTLRSCEQRLLRAWRHQGDMPRDQVSRAPRLQSICLKPLRRHPRCRTGTSLELQRHQAEGVTSRHEALPAQAPVLWALHPRIRCRPGQRRVVWVDFGGSRRLCLSFSSDIRGIASGIAERISFDYAVVSAAEISPCAAQVQNRRHKTETAR